jgi:murein DD-endopeptidase
MLMSNGSAAKVIRNRLTRWTTTVLLAALLGGGIVVVSAPSSASAASYTGVLGGGSQMRSGDRLTSPNGEYRLDMQSDGNLVLTSGFDRVMWATMTYGNPGAWFAVQGDGNLVVYSATNAVLWQANRNGTTNNSLSLQNDGNLVLYSGTTARWFTGIQVSSIGKEQVLKSGWSLHALNTALVMQTDGNLVLEDRSTRRVLWNSGTYGHPGAWAKMGNDGNFAVYEGTTAIWSPLVSNSSASRLEVSSAGFFAMYSTTGTRYWTAGTVPVPPAQGLTFRVPSSGTVSGFVNLSAGGSGYCDGTQTRHKGWDIYGPSTGVYSSAAGTVTYSGWDPNAGTGSTYGNMILIDHGQGYVTRYAHLSSRGVSAGAVVSQGQQIGITGGTGPAGGYPIHLHFELIVQDTPSSVWNSYFQCGAYANAGSLLP